MSSIISAIKTVFLVILLILLLGLGVGVIKNCADAPINDDPTDIVEVEDIILNETQIVF